MKVYWCSHRYRRPGSPGTLCDPFMAPQETSLPAVCVSTMAYSEKVLSTKEQQRKYDQTYRSKHREERLELARIDRLNATRGYVRGNVAVISHRANTIKNTGMIEEHELVIAYMKRHLNGIQ